MYSSQRDFTHYVTPEEYGVLSGAATSTNELLTDIPQPDQRFLHPLPPPSWVPPTRSRKTAQSASTAIGEISVTIDGIGERRG